jgi:hypothetical protein
VISLSELNPLALPSVALTDRKQLPEAPCIYFAIDAEGLVQYIGLTKNLNKRWAYTSHNHYEALSKMGFIEIRFAQVPDAKTYEVHELERALIRKFTPPLNTHDNPSGERYKKIFSKEAIAARSEKSRQSNAISRAARKGIEVTDKRKISVYLPDDLKRKAEKLAESKKRSLSNLIEVLLQEAVDKAEAEGVELEVE